MPVFSPEILLFSTLALILTALAVWWAIRPLLSDRKRARMSKSTIDLQAQAAVHILQEQYAELQHDFRRGAISQAQWLQSCREIERRTLAEGLAATPISYVPSEKLWVPGVISFIVIGAMTGYLLLGTPAANLAQNVSSPTSENRDTSLASAVSTLAQRLENNGVGTPQEWAILARSHRVLKAYEDAVNAYLQWLALEPENADALTGYAEALLLRDDVMNPAAIQALERALQIAPDHPQALFLSGSLALRKGDHAKAVAYWSTLLENLKADDPDALYLKSLIDDARQ